MATGSVIPFQRRGYGIALLFLMLLHSLSAQESNSSQEDEISVTDSSSNATSSDRGKWYHVHLDDEEKDNEAVVREANSKYVSSTVLMKLFPYEDEMDDYQTSVYENGLKTFLIEQFGSRQKFLEIKDVSVINSRIAITTDRQQEFEEEDHVMHVTANVLAESKLESSPLSSEAFSIMVVSYCTEFSAKLILSWQTEEDNTIDRTDDRFEDGITFAHVFDFEVEAIAYENEDTNEESKKISITGITISMIFFGLCICSPFFYIWIRQRKQEPQHFDCMQDSASGDIDSIPPTKLAPPEKRRLFPRRNKKYGIIESVITFDQSTEFESPSAKKKKKRKKHKYARIAKSACSSTSSSTDMDVMSAISSVGSSSGDDESLASIKTTVLRGRHVFQKECSAPAGKLGVSIDTVDGQPVVHRVKESSPLHGMLQRLDIIISIDEIDTSTMSAADVTLIMARRMGKERRITFLRGVKKKLEFV